MILHLNARAGRKRRAGPTLFSLGIHYAIKSRFADDVNEANCIPGRVSRLVKQTSASQLKRRGGGHPGRYSVFSGPGPECLFFSALLFTECITTLNHKIIQSCIQSGCEWGLLMGFRRALRRGHTVAVRYILFLLT